MHATDEEKAKTSEGFGWPGAIGAVDGVLFKLKDTPAVDAIYYYCRKKFYGVMPIVGHRYLVKLM